MTLRKHNTYPPWVAQLKSRWSLRVVRLSSQEASESSVTVHHCDCPNISSACTLPRISWIFQHTLLVPLIYRMPRPLPTVLHMSELRKTRTGDSKKLYDGISISFQVVARAIAVSGVEVGVRRYRSHMGGGLRMGHPCGLVSISSSSGFSVHICAHFDCGCGVLERSVRGVQWMRTCSVALMRL
jgi:hypothetical protein